jgi:GMC oxidoreductase
LTPGPTTREPLDPVYGSALRRQIFTNLEDKHQATHLWNNDIMAFVSLGGSTCRISADKILVCGGYVNTPLLLMRSGYGPGS